MLLSFYKISKNRLDQCFWSSNCAVGEIGIYGLSAGGLRGRRAEERKALTSIKEALPSHEQASQCALCELRKFLLLHRACVQDVAQFKDRH